MTQILLVEGTNGYHVVSSLCQRMAVEETFKIKESKGIEQLLSELKVMLKGCGDTRTIGVVIDADTDIKVRWDSLCDVLNRTGKYGTIPSVCPSSGLVVSPIEKDDIRFGVWIMPNNEHCGMLENFVSFLIPEDDKLIPIVDETLHGIEVGELNKYAPIHHEKARIHTWLAWQEVPGIPMGQAITRKYLSTEPLICQNFIMWLNRLFNN